MGWRWGMLPRYVRRVLGRHATSKKPNAIIRTVWKGSTLPMNKTRSDTCVYHIKTWSSSLCVVSTCAERKQIRYWSRTYLGGWARNCRHSNRSSCPTVWETGAPSLDVAILWSLANWGRSGATWGASLARASRERAGVMRAHFWSISPYGDAGVLRLRCASVVAWPAIRWALSRTVDGRRRRHNGVIFSREIERLRRSGDDGLRITPAGFAYLWNYP